MFFNIASYTTLSVENSTHKGIKTYVRNSTCEDRLNGLAAKPLDYLCINK